MSAGRFLRWFLYHRLYSPGNLPATSNFPSLRTIKHTTRSISHSSPYRPEFDELLTLLLLPSLERLEIMIWTTRTMFFWPSVTPCLLQLTALDLTYSYMTEECLAQLLSTMPNLEVLKYELYCGLDAHGLRYLDMTKFREALETVQQTLRSLVLVIYFFETNSSFDDYSLDGVSQSDL